MAKMRLLINHECRKRGLPEPQLWNYRIPAPYQIDCYTTYSSIVLDPKLFREDMIPELVERYAEERKVVLLRQSDIILPSINGWYTLQRNSPLFYDMGGNLIPVSNVERQLLVSLTQGDHMAWYPYIDYLAEHGMELQSRLLLHYLQQWERVKTNATQS